MDDDVKKNSTLSRGPPRRRGRCSRTASPPGPPPCSSPSEPSASFRSPSCTFLQQAELAQLIPTYATNYVRFKI